MTPRREKVSDEMEIAALHWPVFLKRSICSAEWCKVMACNLKFTEKTAPWLRRSTQAERYGRIDVYDLKLSKGGWVQTSGEGAKQQYIGTTTMDSREKAGKYGGLHLRLRGRILWGMGKHIFRATPVPAPVNETTRRWSRKRGTASNVLRASSWNLYMFSHVTGKNGRVVVEGGIGHCKTRMSRSERQGHVVCLLKIIFTNYSNVVRLGRVVRLLRCVPLKSSLYWFNLMKLFFKIPNASQLLRWILLLQLVPKLMECCGDVQGSPAVVGLFFFFCWKL